MGCGKRTLVQPLNRILADGDGRRGQALSEVWLVSTGAVNMAMLDLISQGSDETAASTPTVPRGRVIG